MASAWKSSLVALIPMNQLKTWKTITGTSTWHYTCIVAPPDAAPSATDLDFAVAPDRHVLRLG